MPRKLKVGIVGCGLIARKKHIPIFLKLKEKVSVQAVCDRNENLAKQTGRDFGISGIYSDFTSMLAKEDLDLIDICTPPQTHITLANEGMEHGCHVLLEKPMALKASDCDAMIETARKKDVKLSVCHNMLFFPVFIKARKLVSEGCIGTFTGIRIYISDPRDEKLMKKDAWDHKLSGGVLEESVAHPIYLSLPFIGKVINVDTWARKYLRHSWTPFDEFRIELEGEKGISSIVKSYANKSWGATVDIFGTGGALHLDLHSNILVYNRQKESLKTVPIALYSLGTALQTISGVSINALKVITGRMEYGQALLIDNFVDCVMNDSEPYVSAEDGRESTRVTEMLVDKLYQKYGDHYEKDPSLKDKKLKILQVIQFFAPIHGGSVMVPYQLSRELANDGHDVAIYTSDYKVSPKYVDSLGKVNVFPFKTSLHGQKLCFTPDMVRKIKDEIKQFDIIHMHNYRTYQNIVVYRYAKKYNIPYVLQAHGSLTTFFQKKKRKMLFDRLWGYNILRDASKLIAVTPREAEQYKSMGIDASKIEIVPNGIDIAEFENLPERGKFRAKYGLGDNEKLILYLGRIEELKGISLLIESLAGLLKGSKNIKLSVVGPDFGDMDRLKSLAKHLKVEHEVLFTGPLFQKDKLEAYVDADVFVLPSFYEIFGISALEALACGKPTIITDRCGLAGLIKYSSLSVVGYDQKQIEEAISKVLSNGFHPQKDIKELIKEKFDWTVIARQIEDIYKKILS